MHAHPNVTPSRYLELEALQEAVRWPSVERRTIVVLAAQFLATRQDQSGYAYFHERVAVHPDEPLFLALEGVFQARLFMARAGVLPPSVASAWRASTKSKSESRFR